MEEQAADGLGDDPDAGGEHEAGFDEGGEAFDLAVAVVVVFVGGAVGHLDGEEGEGCGDEVDGRVRGLGEHAEGPGEETGDELENGDEEGSEYGEEGGRTLGGASRHVGPASRVVSGRCAHGSDGTGCCERMAYGGESGGLVAL